MLMPMDRIPRYKVLLQELLQSTSDDHVDYGPLQTSIEKVNDVVHLIDDNIREQENQSRVAHFERAYGVSLKGRRIILDGLMRKVCRRHTKEFHFVLLDNGTSFRWLV